MQTWKLALLCLDLAAGLTLGARVTADLHPPARIDAPLVDAAQAPGRTPRDLALARPEGRPLRADYGRASTSGSSPSPRR